MKHEGYDECSEYEYHDIVNYKHCCRCKCFYNNEKAQRFECLRKTEECCYTDKFKDEKNDWKEIK